MAIVKLKQLRVSKEIKCKCCYLWTIGKGGPSFEMAFFWIYHSFSGKLMALAGWNMMIERNSVLWLSVGQQSECLIHLRIWMGWMQWGDWLRIKVPTFSSSWSLKCLERSVQSPVDPVYLFTNAKFAQEGENFPPLLCSLSFVHLFRVIFPKPFIVCILDWRPWWNLSLPHLP